MQTVVYRASPGQPVEEAIGLLCAAGLSPCILNRANPDHFILWAAKGTYCVEIAVPAEQAPRAGELLKAIDDRHAQQVKHLTVQFRTEILRNLGGAAALSVLIALGVVARGGFGLVESLMLWFWLTMIGAVLWSVADRWIVEVRRRRREARRHQCQECGHRLTGLTEARCPECDLAFDPALLPELRPSSPAVAEDQTLSPTWGDLVRRTIATLLCFCVFDWSFVPPWRAALEEPEVGEGVGDVGTSQKP